MLENIFSIDRIDDSAVEGGESLTLGMEYSSKHKSGDDFINLSLVQKANYKDVFSKNILINCGIGVGVGLLIRAFGKKKYFKRNKLNRIWIQEI